SKPHAEYNRAVANLWNQFKQQHGVTDATCSKALASKFVGEIAKSKDSNVGGFLKSSLSADGLKKLGAAASIGVIFSTVAATDEAMGAYQNFLDTGTLTDWEKQQLLIGIANSGSPMKDVIAARLLEIVE